MLRLTPPVRQPPPTGLFAVVEVVVLPTNAVPPVNLPEIVVAATVAYVRASPDPVDVLPLFHLTDTLAVPGFEYVMTCAQLSLSVAPPDTVKSPLVIPGVPVQPEIVPLAVRVWATLAVGDTGGVNVSVPASPVHVNAVAAPAGDVVTDEAEVVDAEGAELFEELLEHAGRTTTITINAATETTRRVRTCVTPVPATMGGASYAALDALRSGAAREGDRLSRRSGACFRTARRRHPIRRHQGGCTAIVRNHRSRSRRGGARVFRQRLPARGCQHR